MSRAGGNLVGGGGPAGDPGGSPWSVLETVPELFLETPMHLTFIFCEARGRVERGVGHGRVKKLLGAPDG